MESCKSIENIPIHIRTKTTKHVDFREYEPGWFKSLLQTENRNAKDFSRLHLYERNYGSHTKVAFDCLLSETRP